VRGDARLRSLAEVVRDEAERLDSDIQNLLDATRITARGVEPKREWVDPIDIVNAATGRLQRRLGNHRVELTLEPDLPLLLVDQGLVEQALGQVLGNAVKYSPAGSTIGVGAYRHEGNVVLSIRDEGAGLTGDEQARVGERSFRGRRHEAVIGGSGLGLWIAQTFVTANGGRFDAWSYGEGRGTTVALSFPVSEAGMITPADGNDE
jgi:two-component system sensor histidine kinase KdpD